MKLRIKALRKIIHEAMQLPFSRGMVENMESKSIPTKFIDMLTDGQSGAGGFIRAFNGSSYTDVDTDEAEEAYIEDDDREPLIAIVVQTAKEHGIDTVIDGGMAEEMGREYDGESDDDLSYRAFTVDEWVENVRNRE